VYNHIQYVYEISSSICAYFFLLKSTLYCKSIWKLLRFHTCSHVLSLHIPYHLTPLFSISARSLPLLPRQRALCLFCPLPPTFLQSKSPVFLKSCREHSCIHFILISYRTYMLPIHYCTRFSLHLLPSFVPPRFCIFFPLVPIVYLTYS